MIREQRKTTSKINNMLAGRLRHEDRERQPYPLESFTQDLPDTVGAYAHETQRLVHEFSAVETVDNIFVRPVKAAQGLRREIDKAAEEVGTLSQPIGKMEGLVLSNMLGRLESLQTRLGEYDKLDFDYMKILKAVGIYAEDIEASLRRYAQFDTQSTAETLLAIGEEFDPVTPESTKQAEKVKEYYVKFLELSFNMAPRKVRELFVDFEDYMDKTVNFVEDKEGGSYEKTDTIFLNTYESGTIVDVRKGDRWVAIVDPFMIAAIVAEEGLLGHQGHFLLSENSEIPGFMKRDMNPITQVHAETMVRIGKTMLINELKKDHSLVPDLSKEDFSMLERYYETRKEMEGFQIFEIMYTDYVYFTTGEDVNKASTALFELSKGDDTFKSEAYKRKMLAYYNGKFWEEYRQRIGKWAYVMANENARKFEERMQPMDEERRERVLEQLRLGYWPPSSLRYYFDYLVEDEPQAKAALRS